MGRVHGIRGMGGVVDVGGRTPLLRALMPSLRMRQIPERPMAARFSVVNPMGAKGAAKKPYRWKVTGPPRPRQPEVVKSSVPGAIPIDVTVLPGASTPLAFTVIDFEQRVDPHSPSTTFTVTVTGGTLKAPLSQEVRVWSTYHLLKRLGSLWLPCTELATGPIAGLDVVRFLVRNPEEEPVALTAQRLEWLHLDGGGSGPRAAGTAAVTIAAGETEKVSVSLGERPPGATGVAVHLEGASASGIPARTSAYFRLPELEERLPLRAPELQKLWDDPRLWVQINGIRQLDFDRLRAAGYEDTALTAIAEPPVYKTRKHTPSDLGKECFPEHDEDTNELVCAATGGTTTRRLPGSLLNARKGDILLLPGIAGAPIATMAAALNPPQLHSHCAIVTSDHREVRHCTASGEWLLDQVELSATPHIPEDRVRFVWPGSVTQTADQLAHGSEMATPGGESYTIGPWHLERSFELVAPLVVKPPPGEEFDDPSVRTRLNAAADAALATNAHYRWFCHTDGDFGTGTINIVPSLDPFVPDKPVPSMCSVFVWRSALAAGIKFERAPGTAASTPVTADDLEQADTDGGAEVAAPGAAPGPTRDGFYLYTAQEREDAGNALQEFFVDEAIDAVPGIAAGVAEGVATLISNQVLNALADDDSSLASANTDTPHWKDNVQPANTVFPTDMLFWDPPSAGGAYGIAEPLRYAAPELIVVPAYAWALRQGDGTVKGRVTDGGAGVAHADVWSGPAAGYGMRHTTDAQGRFSFPLPANSAGVQHVLWATKGARTGPGPAGATVTVVTGETTERDIALLPPPTDSRVVMVRGSIEIGDSVHELERVHLHIDAAAPTESREVLDEGTGPVIQVQVVAPVPGLLEASVRVRATLANPATGLVTLAVRVDYDYLLPLIGADTRTGTVSLPPLVNTTRHFPFSTGQHDIKVDIEAFNDQGS